MKKVVTVHIAGEVFQVEEDGYNNLQKVLQKIEQSSPNGVEQAKDAEQRICNLLLSKVQLQNRLITCEQINDALTTLGYSNYINQDRTYQTYQPNNNYPGYKRLYRHPYDKIFGGVCGGVAAYVKTDPVLIRIAYVLLFFGFGTGLLLYLIMWIIVPLAATPQQFEELTGNSPRP